MKEEVRNMFDSISKHYDFLNHFLSMGTDRRWRKKVIKILKNYQLSTNNYQLSSILDLATGTGDLAIAEATLLVADSASYPVKITGIDISEKMLEIAQKKIESYGLKDKIELMLADGENLPFSNNTFDAATIAFGIRNYEAPLKGLQEIYRVLAHNGILAGLEFSRPSAFPVKQMYNLYFQSILPFTGRLISKSKTAYSYLPDSVSSFPDGNDFLKLMNDAGFVNTRFQKLSLGIASIYTGEKR